MNRIVLAGVVSLLLVASLIAGITISQPHKLGVIGTSLQTETQTTSSTTSLPFTTTSSETLGCSALNENNFSGFTVDSNSTWLTYKHDPQRTGFVNQTSASNVSFQGRLAWHNCGIGLSSELVSFDNRVFASNYWLYALNATTGNEIWNISTGVGPYPAIASNGSNVYMVSNLGGFYGWDPSTGKQVTSVAQVEALGSIAIEGDVAYVTSQPRFGFQSKPSGLLQALEITTGKVFWSYNLSSYHFYGGPTLNGRIVFIPASNNTLFAINASSGQLLWKKDFNSNITFSPVYSPTGAIFLATTDGHVYSLDSSNGSEIWSLDLNVSTSIVSSPALGYDQLFIGTSSGVYSLNATSGAVMWHSALDNGTEYTSPTVINGHVFISNYNGNLYELNASNGILLWSFSQLGEGAVSEPIYAFGLTIIDGNNGVFAFY